MQIKEKESRETSSLTESEQRLLQSVILGHGKLKGAAEKVKLNTLSVSRIAITGRGYKKNIQKIRRKLLEPIGIKENNVEIRQDKGLGNQANITNDLQKAV